MHQALTCHFLSINRKKKKQTNKVSSGDHEHTITRHLDCDHLISSTPAFTFSWPSDENDFLSATLTPFSLTTLHFDSQQTKQTSSSQKTQYLSLKLSLSLSLSLPFCTFHQFLA
jgi:hypothetical protein